MTEKTQTLVRRQLGTGRVEVINTSPIVAVNSTVEFVTRLVTGGGDEQVSEIGLTFETFYRTRDGYRRTEIDNCTLATNLSVESGRTVTQETQVIIPQETPSTIGTVDVLATVTIDANRTTVEEETYLETVPSDRFLTVFNTIVDLGFVLRDVECQMDPSRAREYVQRFNFRPRSGEFRDSVSDLELYLHTTHDRLVLRFGVDRDDAHLSSLPQADHARLELHSVADVKDRLRSVIKRTAGE